MKKSQRLHFTIQAGRSESYKDRVFLGFFCSFLLFFFACGSFDDLLQYLEQKTAE